jgi:hypothetical protein
MGSSQSTISSTTSRDDCKESSSSKPPAPPKEARGGAEDSDDDDEPWERRGRGGVGRAEDDDDEKDDDDDCPACVEYTAGPCGEQFQAWLDCTNRHENDYEIQCKTQFHNFHNCLQWKLHHTTLMEDYLEEEDEEGI